MPICACKETRGNQDGETIALQSSGPKPCTLNPKPIRERSPCVFETRRAQARAASSGLPSYCLSCRSCLRRAGCFCTHHVKARANKSVLIRAGPRLEFEGRREEGMAHSPAALVSARERRRPADLSKHVLPRTAGYEGSCRLCDRAWAGQGGSLSWSRRRRWLRCCVWPQSDEVQAHNVRG